MAFSLKSQPPGVALPTVQTHVLQTLYSMCGVYMCDTKYILDILCVVSFRKKLFSPTLYTEDTTLLFMYFTVLFMFVLTAKIFILTSLH